MKIRNLLRRYPSSLISLYPLIRHSVSFVENQTKILLDDAREEVQRPPSSAIPANSGYMGDVPEVIECDGVPKVIKSAAGIQKTSKLYHEERQLRKLRAADSRCKPYPASAANCFPNY